MFLVGCLVFAYLKPVCFCLLFICTVLSLVLAKHTKDRQKLLTWKRFLVLFLFLLPHRPCGLVFALLACLPVYLSVLLHSFWFNITCLLLCPRKSNSFLSPPMYV